MIAPPVTRARPGPQAALSLARDHALITLGWDKVASFVDPANARSIALMMAVGATRDAEVERALPGTRVYRHTIGGT